MQGDQKRSMQNKNFLVQKVVELAKTALDEVQIKLADKMERTMVEDKQWGLL